MTINFGLHQPGASFAQGFEITNRMMQLAADKAAGTALAKGDRAGASRAYAEQGFVPQAEQVTQQGLNQDQVAAATEASRASTAKTTQEMGQNEDKEGLLFTQRAAQALNDVLTRDGPEAVAPAFDMMVPLLRTRGVNDEQLQSIRQGLTTDPAKVLPAIMAGIEEKLGVAPAGSVVYNKGTGEEIFRAPGVYNPLVEVGPNNNLVDTAQPGAPVIARGPTPPNQQPETWKTLTPQEAEDAGYRPGVVVRRNSAGKEEVVDEPPASASTNPNGAPKISPGVEAALGDERKVLDEMTKVNNSIKEFMVLNEKYKGTGGWLAAPLVKEAAGAFNADIGRMNSITDYVVPNMRQGLPGAASERDTTRFENATLSANKKYDTNLMTATAFNAAFTRMKERVEFFEQYALKYNTLVGAQGMWNRYIEDPENDILQNQGARGEIIVPRVPKYTWREYLKWEDVKLGGDAPKQTTNYRWDPERGLIPQ